MTSSSCSGAYSTSFSTASIRRPLRTLGNTASFGPVKWSRCPIFASVCETSGTIGTERTSPPFVAVTSPMSFACRSTRIVSPSKSTSTST